MKDINNNSIDLAVQATLKFFVDIIHESNVTPSLLHKRVNDRRIANGKDVLPIITISDSDIELFKESFIKTISKFSPNGSNIHLMTDYNPWYILEDIISNSGIENTSSFLFKARFPSKMKIDIKHDIVNLSIDNKQYPVIYISEKLLDSI